jgi:phytoene synthase
MTSAPAVDRGASASQRASEAVTWRAAVRTGHELLARKARSFHLATSFLPAALQDDVAVLYGFCRIADDLADDAGDLEELHRLEEELLGARRARPIISALVVVAERHGFSLTPARLLLEGVATDLGRVRIENDADLLTYSYKVASTVGLMVSRVFGVRDPRAEPFAVDLGLAMQLTNIVRDVREDAARDRVYLPRTRLAAHGIDPDDLVAGRAAREGVRAVSMEVLALADRYYRSAEQGLRFIPFRARIGVAVALRVYASIGWRIRRLAHNPLDGRMVVPGYEKAGQVMAALALSLRASCSPRLGVMHDRALHHPLRVEFRASGQQA